MSDPAREKAARARELYAAQAAAGLCRHLCCTELPAEGRVRCARHIEMINRSRRASQARQGKEAAR